MKDPTPIDDPFADAEELPKRFVLQVICDDVLSDRIRSYSWATGLGASELCRILFRRHLDAEPRAAEYLEAWVRRGAPGDRTLLARKLRGEVTRPKPRRLHRRKVAPAPIASGEAFGGTEVAS